MSSTSRNVLDLQDDYEHFMEVNGIDWPTAQQAVNAAYAMYRKRSKQEWTTEFGPHAVAVNERRASSRMAEYRYENKVSQ